jgi:alkanesulfonate monooxygenase SsuD/methylene tetrahydromethanopterin reductase-like flavin-dependent oxidoreductase (luciferase family)
VITQVHPDRIEEESMLLSLKYDLRLPVFAGTKRSALYRAMLDQCDWADKLGFHFVQLSEHHGSSDGYMPSPLIAASAVAARTHRLQLRIGALLLPLHDPIRVAEDVAMVDLMSNGRLSIIIGGGYVPSEFDMFGKEMSNRAQSCLSGVRLLKSAWAGEGFEFDGRSGIVRPQPEEGGPLILMGGSSRGAARRAVGLADGFIGAPEVERWYREEARRAGVPEGLTSRTRPTCWFMHLSEDPAEAWNEVGPHAMHDTNSYAHWAKLGEVSQPFEAAETVDAVRKGGNYRILTPNDLIELAKNMGPDGEIRFHPLMGGMRPELGWQSLHLFETVVLPELLKLKLIKAEDLTSTFRSRDQFLRNDTGAM